MIKKIQVEGNPHLYRDKYSGAILNCNVEEIKIAKLKRADREKIKILETSVEELKTELSDIKNLLNTLIQEIKK